jgi:hypothetical protein
VRIVHGCFDQSPKIQACSAFALVCQFWGGSFLVRFSNWKGDFGIKHHLWKVYDDDDDESQPHPWCNRNLICYFSKALYLWVCSFLTARVFFFSIRPSTKISCGDCWAVVWEDLQAWLMLTRSSLSFRKSCQSHLWLLGSEGLWISKSCASTRIGSTTTIALRQLPWILDLYVHLAWFFGSPFFNPKKSWNQPNKEGGLRLDATANHFFFSFGGEAGVRVSQFPMFSSRWTLFVFNSIGVMWDVVCS